MTMFNPFGPAPTPKPVMPSPFGMQPSAPTNNFSGTAPSAPANPLSSTPSPVLAQPTATQPPSLPGSPVWPQQPPASSFANGNMAAGMAQQLASPPPMSANIPALAVPAPSIPTFAAQPIDYTDTDIGKTEADLVEEYITLRNTKGEVNEQAKAQLDPINKRMDEIERKMLARLANGGVDSLRTSAGTAFKKLSTKFSVENPEQLMAWVESTSNQQLLKRDVRQDEVREFMDTNGYVPPGVKVFSEFVVQFRKS